MRVIASGQAWGTDAILANPKLKYGLKPARALTFVECSRLATDDLEMALIDFPEERQRIRRAAHWMALRRWLTHTLAEVCVLLRQFHQLRRDRVDFRSSFEQLRNKTLDSVMAHLVGPAFRCEHDYRQRAPQQAARI